jgi:riboflavin biosynthesis pyrimidine reductase
VLLVYDDAVASSPGGELTDDQLRTLLESVPRARAHRPWLLVNMVHSIDGATAAAGRSGGLAGPGDRRLFHLIRNQADTILVGAATVRTERYHPTEQQLVVVSRSLDLPRDLPLFTDPARGPRPVVATTEDADPDAADALSECAEIWRLGRDGVDLVALLSRLGATGAERVLCEGGPRLLGELVSRVDVDEWFVTTGGSLVGGPTSGLLHGAVPRHGLVRLRHVLVHDNDVFAHYLADPTVTSADPRE